MYLYEARGIRLHKAGSITCVTRRPGDLCLSRPAHSARTRTRATRKAIEHFLTYLGTKADEPEVKWLLSLAFMTTGGYPERVPREHLIPPAVFTSAEDIGRFRDVAPQAGLNSVASAGGAIVDDFDNDGDFDVVTSSMNSCERMTFFRNTGDGMFVERGVEAGLADQLGGLNIVQSDYNNDGCVDILNLRGGWQLPQRKSLLRNNCDGTFTDVTSTSGLAMPATSTQTAVWWTSKRRVSSTCLSATRTASTAFLKNAMDFEDFPIGPRPTRLGKGWRLPTTPRRESGSVRVDFSGVHFLPPDGNRRLRRAVHGWVIGSGVASQLVSLTTTTTAGRTSSPPVTSCRSTSRCAPTLGCRTTLRR